MNVLFDQQIFADQKVGGISRYFVELILALDDLPDIEPIMPHAFVLNAYLREQNNRVFRNSHSVRAWNHIIPGRLIRGLNRLIASRSIPASNADIYHPTYYRRMAARFKGRKVIAVMDMIHEKLPSSFPESDPTAARKAMAVREADAVICPSLTTKRDLMEILHIPETKVHVVPLGVSLTETEPPEYLRQLRPYLLMVGARASYKNFRRLLTVFTNTPELYRNVRLVCFGGGPATKAERSLLANTKTQDAVTFISGNDSMLGAIYANAEALVVPSLYEGFGLPLIEAMHCGCPVVAANTGSLPEVAGDAAVLFDPQSDMEMRKALQRVLESTDLRASLARKGKKHASAFTWKRSARLTRDVYLELAQPNAED